MDRGGAWDGGVPEPVRRIGRRYLRASLFWISAGMLLGALMLAFGNDNLRFVHTHALLVGGILFAVYGTVLLVLPSSAPPGGGGVVHAGWAQTQFLVANVGLVGMLAGAVMPVGYGLDRVSVLFGLVEAVAAVLFAFLVGAALSVRRSDGQ